MLLKRMASSNHRNIVVIENLEDNHKNFYLLTITDLIEYKLTNIDESISLKRFKSFKSKEYSEKI